MSVLLIYGNRSQYAIKYGHSVHGNDSYFDATNSWLLSVISHYEVRSISRTVLDQSGTEVLRFIVPM